MLFNGELHYINFKDLVGKGVTIYGQQEIVKDLIARRLADGGQILFEVKDVSVHDFDSDKPKIRFRHGGAAQELDCDVIGGCDGFHGICRPSFPDGVLTSFERDYPFGWVGILSESPPPDDELIYTYHESGFALYTMRSPSLARLYLQCKPNDTEADWPDDRIWEELHIRLGGTRKLEQGKVIDKLITPMRSFVVEPMQYGRLFLAGDSAHIVLLDSYSKVCLRRIWKAQRFSWWMTQMLHRFDDENAFDVRRQLAELDYLVTSRASQITLAENYTGLPLELPD